MTKRRREINRIRTDALELRIAWYIFTGQYEYAQAITDLAREMGAPIDDNWIKARVKRYREIDAE